MQLYSKMLFVCTVWCKSLQQLMFIIIIINIITATNMNDAAEFILF